MAFTFISNFTNNSGFTEGETTYPRQDTTDSVPKLWLKQWKETVSQGLLIRLTLCLIHLKIYISVFVVSSRDEHEKRVFPLPIQSVIKTEIKSAKI